MQRNIWISLLISIGIVIVSTLIGFYLNFCFGVGAQWDKETARYLFSSISQSLAAIIALAFVVLNFITSFASKNLAKYVYRYVFSLRRTLITYFLFALTILYNFLYLAYVDDKSSIIQFPHAFIANLILYVICMAYLGWYATTTYKVAISPFDYFYDEIYKGIPTSVKQLRSFLESRLLINDFVINNKLEYSSEMLCENKQVVYYHGENGYFYSMDLSSLNMVLHLLETNGNFNPTLYYLTYFGRQISDGQIIFAFDNTGVGTNLKIQNTLSHNAVIVKKHPPEWVPEFTYIPALYDIVIDQFNSADQLSGVVEKLKNLAEYYCKLRQQTIADYDESLAGFGYNELLDDWLRGYERLIKAACATKKQLLDEGKIFDEKDEPDYYVSMALQRLLSLLYSLDIPVYYKMCLSSICRYSVYNAKIKNSDFVVEYLSELRYVVMSISASCIKEIHYSEFMKKLERYVNVVVVEYLDAFKKHIDRQESTRVINNRYNFLRHYLVGNIERELRRNSLAIPADSFDNIEIILLSKLFILSVYSFAQLIHVANEKDYFMEMLNIFYRKYIDVHAKKSSGLLPYIRIERILAYSKDLLSKQLHWFMNRVEEDELFDDTVHDSRIRTDEYCYYVYIILLFKMGSSIQLDPIYWTPDKIMTLRHYYIEFKAELSKKGSELYRFFLPANKSIVVTQDQICSDVAAKLDKLILGNDMSEPQ
jgi:hypothetical protein